ncbi:MAG: FkbM family methyltransferase [Geminicoccaceae bacterium]|nr:FkbM family methyltransferase [Geminicoccaceae bacterium]MCB9942072.1 FkbM family methyltransferase [Geminicoccaceae bacterium]
MAKFLSTLDEFVGIFKHNFVKQRKHPDFHRLTVRAAGRFWQVSDGKETIMIAVLSRWRRYRKLGVAGFCADLARDYGEGTFFKVGQGDTIIDIGANIGEFTCFCLSRGAQVLAVEADRTIHEVLQCNVGARPGARTRNVAIAAENGTMTFYSSIEGADSSLVRPDVVDESYEVEAVTLARLIDEAGFDHVDLVKCDAEGAEPEVIRGALPVLHRIRRIAIDCGAERQGEATDSIVGAILEDAGFSVRIGDVHPGRRIVWATNRAIERAA